MLLLEIPEIQSHATVCSYEKIVFSRYVSCSCRKLRVAFRSAISGDGKGKSPVLSETEKGFSSHVFLHFCIWEKGSDLYFSSAHAQHQKERIESKSSIKSILNTNPRCSWRSYFFIFFRQRGRYGHRSVTFPFSSEVFTRRDGEVDKCRSASVISPVDFLISSGAIFL